MKNGNLNQVGEQSSHANKRVAVVGAGIMGRALAWQLCSLGAKVSLFDQDSMDHGCAAAFTAAGMLAPYSELEAAEENIFKLGQYSLTLWSQWLKQWDATQHWCQSGTLVVAHRQDHSSLEHFNRQLQSKLKLRGQPTSQTSSMRCLQHRDLESVEPELAQQFSQATLLRREAWLDNHKLMATVAKQLLAAGVEWRENCKVSSVAPYSLQSAKGLERFDHVFDCRGLGAKAQLKTLRAVRGEVIRVQTKEVGLSHMVRLMHPRYRLYLVPKPNNEFVLGATQIESEDYSPISVRSALELLSALYAIHPGFGEARILQTDSNCRPALPDNQPIIKHQAGLSEINGLFRHGFLLAPALADITSRVWQNKPQASTELEQLSQQIIQPGG